MSRDPSRVHYWHTNSSTGGPGAGWGLWRNGWGGTLAAMKTARDLGITSTIIRGPEGDADGLYPLDFYVPTGVSKWIGAAATRRFVALVHAMGLKVTPYFGSMTHDLNLDAAYQADDLGAWNWMIQETIRPWVDAGCRTLAFDHVGAHATPDHPAFHELRKMQRFSGLKILGEPHGEGVDNLTVTGDELDGCVVTDNHWRAAWKKADFREQFAGRVIRITSELDAVQPILDDGHEAAVTWAVIKQMEGSK